LKNDDVTGMDYLIRISTAQLM